MEFGERELDEYFENTNDIEQMLRISEELLNDEERHKRTCHKLLEKISSSESSKETKLILQFLANRITPTESLINYYADMLGWHQESKLLIEYIPAIVGEEENQIQIIFDKMKELFYNEIDFQVALIGSMAEIKLTEKMKIEAFEMIIHAFSVVEKEDLPTILRTLFKTATKSNYLKVIYAVRKNISQRNVNESMPLLLEVLVTSLKMSPTNFTKLFIKSIYASEVTTTDMFILLALACCSQYKDYIRDPLTQKICDGEITVDQIECVLKCKEVMNSYTQSLLMFANIILTEKCIERFDINSISKFFSIIFENYPNLCNQLVRSLIMSCIENQSEEQQHSGSITTTITTTTPNKKQKVTKDYVPLRYQQQEKVFQRFSVSSLLSFQILLKISKKNPRILETQSRFIEEFIYQFHTILSPILFSHALISLAIVSQTKSSLRSSLLMFTQKQLCYADLPNNQICGVITASHLLNKNKTVEPLKEFENILQWIFKILCSSSNTLLKTYILDLFITNLDFISQDNQLYISLDKFVNESLAGLDYLEVEPNNPLSNKKMMICNYFESEFSSRKNHLYYFPMLIFTLFHFSYLNKQFDSLLEYLDMEFQVPTSKNSKKVAFYCYMQISILSTLVCNKIFEICQSDASLELDEKMKEKLFKKVSKVIEINQILNKSFKYSKKLSLLPTLNLELIILLFEPLNLDSTDKIDNKDELEDFLENAFTFHSFLRLIHSEISNSFLPKTSSKKSSLSPYVLMSQVEKMVYSTHEIRNNPKKLLKILRNAKFFSSLKKNMDDSEKIIYIVQEKIKEDDTGHSVLIDLWKVFVNIFSCFLSIFRSVLVFCSRNLDLFLSITSQFFDEKFDSVYLAAKKLSEFFEKFIKLASDVYVHILLLEIMIVLKNISPKELEILEEIFKDSFKYEYFSYFKESIKDVQLSNNISSFNLTRNKEQERNNWEIINKLKINLNGKRDDIFIVNYMIFINLAMSHISQYPSLVHRFILIVEELIDSQIKKKEIDLLCKHSLYKFITLSLFPHIYKLVMSICHESFKFVAPYQQNFEEIKCYVYKPILFQIFLVNKISKILVKDQVEILFDKSHDKSVNYFIFFSKYFLKTLKTHLLTILEWRVSNNRTSTDKSLGIEAVSPVIEYLTIFSNDLLTTIEKIKNYSMENNTPFAKLLPKFFHVVKSFLSWLKSVSSVHNIPEKSDSFVLNQLISDFECNDKQTGNLQFDPGKSDINEELDYEISLSVNEEDMSEGQYLDQFKMIPKKKRANQINDLIVSEESDEDDPSDQPNHNKDISDEKDDQSEEKDGNSFGTIYYNFKDL